MATPDLSRLPYRLPQAGGQTASGIYFGAVATVVGVVGVAIWTATQYAAYRLRFHPALGAPLLVVSLPYRARSCWKGCEVFIEEERRYS